MCLDGQAEIINNTDGRTFPVTRGETLLFPAVMTSLSARGTATPPLRPGINRIAIKIA